MTLGSETEGLGWQTRVGFCLMFFWYGVDIWEDIALLALGYSALLMTFVLVSKWVRFCAVAYIYNTAFAISRGSFKPVLQLSHSRPLGS